MQRTIACLLGWLIAAIIMGILGFVSLAEGAAYRVAPVESAVSGVDAAELAATREYFEAALASALPAPSRVLYTGEALAEERGVMETLGEREQASREAAPDYIVRPQLTELASVRRQNGVMLLAESKEKSLRAGLALAVEDARTGRVVFMSFSRGEQKDELRVKALMGTVFRRSEGETDALAGALQEAACRAAISLADWAK